MLAPIPLRIFCPPVCYLKNKEYKSTLLHLVFCENETWTLMRMEACSLWEQNT